MTRDEHLVWCKKRANEYFDRGDIKNGCMSFLSDMQKHNDNCNHSALGLMIMLMPFTSIKEARDFINGFN